MSKLCEKSWLVIPLIWAQLSWILDGLTVFVESDGSEEISGLAFKQNQTECWPGIRRSDPETGTFPLQQEPIKWDVSCFGFCLDKNFGGKEIRSLEKVHDRKGNYSARKISWISLLALLNIVFQTSVLYNSIMQIVSAPCFHGQVECQIHKTAQRCFSIGCKGAVRAVTLKGKKKQQKNQQLSFCWCFIYVVSSLLLSFPERRQLDMHLEDEGIFKSSDSKK